MSNDVMKRHLREMSDDDNPNYLLQGKSTKIVLGMALGKIDGKKLARQEMANRGFGKKGEWVGFEKAEKIWGIK